MHQITVVESNNYPFMCFSLSTFILLFSVSPLCWSTETVHTPIRFSIESDSYSENRQFDEVIFRGNVKLVYDDIEMEGDEIVVIHKTGKPIPEKVTGSGNIMFYQQGGYKLHVVVKNGSFVLMPALEKIVIKSATSIMVNGVTISGTDIYYDLKNKQITGIIL